ncbi:MAG: copper ion binding protein [Oscillospiraceae bacterium]|jgi:copper chaperone|nr:copper ion binding protein [Oscillospiraceae bacterium]
MESLVLNVEGMMCEHCKAAVTRAVSALQGVSAVSVDLEAGRVTVMRDPAKATADDIVGAIEEEGYEVVI